MFTAKLKAIPAAMSHKVAYPIRALRDIPTGEFVKTPRGNFVMMGGYHPTNSTTGPGNCHKTDEIFYGPMKVLSHIQASQVLAYDTESSLGYRRFEDRKGMFYGLEEFDFSMQQYLDNPRFMLWQRGQIEGDEFFEAIKEYGRERSKDKKNMITLPICDPAGNPIRILAPSIVVIDSLSAMSASSIQEKIVDKNAVGDSGQNTVFMKDGAMKTQLITQLPVCTAKYGMHFAMTAHIGDHIQMDQYAPKPLSLQFSKNGTKQKGVPQKFQFINDFVGEIYNAKPLVHPVDKSPKYPYSEADREKGNDLIQITEVSSRNKNGQSGVVRPIIVSQRDGILPGMTEFDYIKETCKKWGISGNNTTFHMDLRPDVNIGRTTVQKKIRDDWRLDTAMRITAEMNQMRLLWKDMEDILCTPEELYNDIKNMGYDWDILLFTRYWWVPTEEEKNQDFNELTTYDLLMMRKGLYHPYWLEDDKVTVKKAWLTNLHKEKEKLDDIAEAAPHRAKLLAQLK
ncbi:UvsX-like recombinase [Vibrio phage vB_VpaM_sm033]|nr:UvsX-like recombinase [Vibrio phage vB_VpaM_sm033]